MGLREYLRRTGDGTRFRVSLALAFLVHCAVFAAGSLGLATQVQYGMAGASASSGGAPEVRLPAEETVDLEDDPAQAPAEQESRPTPRPTTDRPKGSGGPLSGGALEVPSYLENPPPPYPEEAKRLGEEGEVVLWVGVDSNGGVQSAAVLKSSGFPLLDEAARKTVLGWRFKPARMAGLAVSTRVKVPVLFRLQDAGG
jgi:TonB family protein